VDSVPTNTATLAAAHAAAQPHHHHAARHARREGDGTLDWTKGKIGRPPA
jgi:hypothetical protein